MRIYPIVFLLIGFTACNINQPFSGESGKEITLRLEPQQGNPRNSEGDFIQLKDGRILFIYTHFTGGSGDHACAYLAGRYSSDGGKTWSEPIRCMDADGYHVVNNDRLVQLQNGRIIYPTALHKTVQSKLEATGQIMCYYSDDNGQTWAKSQQVANPENIILQEPGLIELKNGRIMLFCRTESGVQYFSFSTDKGRTWSAVKPGNIKSPLSPASIERIPETGDLLLVWNNNYEPVRDGGKRTPYNLAISENEGTSWQKIKTIDSDSAGWYCYTAIEFVDDHVLLGHCAGDRKVNNGLETTQITRISLDWIYQDP